VGDGVGAIVIDHLNIGVSDVAASRAFYERALAPLGYVVLIDRPYGVGFGKDGKPDFWVSDRPASAPLHVAFASPDRATVDAFHREALAAGGRDNGPPGLRPHYHPSYYGAFVLDPDGHNVEAVSHGPQ
jgi:catechol 2,3-dioxygenase-like lactoylglutathione lyase family enzyme